MGFPTRGFHMEGIAKHAFSGNRFQCISGPFVVVFLKPGEPFSGFLGFENTLENATIFRDVTKSEPGIWRGESTTDLSPLKNKSIA